MTSSELRFGKLILVSVERLNGKKARRGEKAFASIQEIMGA